MSKRNTLSVAEKVKVVNFLVQNKEACEELDSVKLSNVIKMNTGIRVEPTSVTSTYRPAAEYRPLNVVRAANRPAKAPSLEAKVAELEARLGRLEVELGFALEA